MVAPAITDPFFRTLHSKLADEINSRVSALAAGSAITLGKDVGIDAVATAINYQKAVSYIEALQQVIELCVEIDHERYGRKSSADNGDE